jgi:cytochrome c
VAVVGPRVALASLAMVLAAWACEPVTPPPAAAPSAASGAQPAPAAADRSFDAGPVRTPAEYLAEPQFVDADVARGQLLSLACAACHTFNVAGGTLVGPNLHGVFGRRVASVAGFDYSPALASSTIVWTPVSLEAWLSDPAGFVAGTKMAFTGYRSAADRRDLIAYLLHATE